MDDVTVGTSAPVEQLAAVAMAGDEHALQENSRMLTSYARTLKGMVDAAVAGWVADSEKRLLYCAIFFLFEMWNELGNDDPGSALFLL